MNRSRVMTFLSTNLPALIFAIILLTLFWKPLFTVETLYSLDSPPLYNKTFSQQLGDAFSGSWRTAVLGHSYVRIFHPTRLLAFMAPPLTYHTLMYLVNTLLIFAATFYFLRIRGFKGYAAYLPAIGFSLSGYLFTLISAGHIYTFDLIPYMILLFAFLEQAIRKGSFFYFTLAGTAAGLGVASRMPDLMALFGALAFIYALFRLVQCTPRNAWRSFVLRRVIGGALSLLIFGLLAVQPLHWLVSKVAPNRAQMQGNTAVSKWEYATNWSLPPAEILEFIAPCVFGNETTDLSAPYWGKLGSPMNWDRNFESVQQQLQTQSDPNARAQLQNINNQLLRGMNYRQHTIYLGVIPVVFALYAFGWAWRNRRRSGVEPGALDLGPGTLVAAQRPEIYFWGIAALASMLLSFGRYFEPLYRVYFLIPVYNKMRCPVKFVHLLEFSVCMLFAFGLAAFLTDRLASQTRPQQKQGKSKKRAQAPSPRRTLMFFTYLCLGTGLLMAAVAMIRSAQPGDLVTYWQSIGRADYAPVMLRAFTGGLLHGAVLFFVCAGTFIAIRFFPRAERLHSLLPLLLLFAMAIDLTIVNRKFIRTKDMTPWQADNPIADLIKEAGPSRTAYLPSPASKRDWIYGNFDYHDIDFSLPNDREAASLDPEERSYYSALQNNPLRLWQLTGTAHIVGRVDSLRQLIQHPAMKFITYFDTANSRIKTTPNEGSHVLLRYAGALPKASVYHAWQAIENDEAATAKLAAPDWDPRQSLLLSSSDPSRNSTTAPSPVEIVDYTRTRVTLKTTIREPGILLLNDRLHPAWTVSVNGNKQAILRCNALMRGVRLEPGEHEVVFRYLKPPLYKWPFRITMGILFGLSVWTVGRLITFRSGSEQARQTA